MEHIDTIKLSYDDITIIPSSLTVINSRSECNPFDENGMLPIFTAPMDTVVDIECAETFHNNHINVVLPRTTPYDVRYSELLKGKYFVAFSLGEVEKMNFTPFENTNTPHKICIDLANGHMLSLLSCVRTLKERFGDKMIIMTGNIANPKTYELYENAGVDYCRVGIGGGEGCLTSTCVGVHYPYFSLLREIYDVKIQNGYKCKVIADGNIKGFADIQKALINADYVMIGGLFNRAIDSAGEIYYGKSYFTILGNRFLRPFKTLFTYGRKISPKDKEKALKQIKNGTLDVIKKFYGMSTKVAQSKMGNNKLKTSEGVIKYNKVLYSMKGWVENEIDYLRSAMSYTNSRDLTIYKGSNWIKINNIRFNK